ncbi:unnamed protein product [marine sediment metagenome]|uniref:Uncharacterized protein n=2 Tax=marine sediment metagenome TaxID=412755 RepID=X1AK39_9ZZZZ
MSAEEAQVAEFNDALDRETKELMAMKPESRYTYVVNVIESLSQGIKQIISIKKKIPQAKAAEQFLNELNINAPTLIPPIMFMLKPEYRPIFNRLLESMAGDQKQE